MTSIAVLISGRGSNLEAIINAKLPVTIAGVISNNPAAAGLKLAEDNGIPSEVIDHRLFPSRDAFDAKLAVALDAWKPDLIVLAGFMRLLTDAFIQRYQSKLINIHPSLLPAFTGLYTHRRALASGVKIHGCSVHFVTAELDLGPIIIQAAVPVFDTDNEASLSARVLVQEHRILPQAIRWFAQGDLSLIGNRVNFKAEPRSDAVLCVPRVP